MAVTRVGNNTWTLTAAADAVAQPLKLTSLRWIVTGGTVGQELRVLDKASGTLLAKHLVTATTESVELLIAPKWVAGVYVDAIPAAGGGTLVAIAE